MQKRPLIYLIASLLGILLLFYLCLFLKPQRLTISQITTNNLNEQVWIEAKVIKVADFPQSSFQILTLKDKTGEIKATSNSEKQLKITPNQIYIIEGKLTEYNHTLQIAIDKIEIKNT
jgi:DNA/RNA endonuclease YhcR with UshA esterase domain